MAGRLASLIGRFVLPKRPRGFVRDERGATAIEFGFLAIPFFAIIGAILETSVVFLSTQVLDSAVQDASRLIRTGQAQKAAMTVVSFKKDVCDRLYGLFPDCTNLLHVEVRLVNTFNAIEVTAPIDPACKTKCGWTRDEVFTPGAGSSIVVVQVYYKFPVVIGIGNTTMATLPDNLRLLGSTAVFRNEPFTS